MSDLGATLGADQLPADLLAALPEIAAGAEPLDRAPRFPHVAFATLRKARIQSATLPGADGERPSLTCEWGILRAVAAADASVGRILDGHYNAVDRLTAAAAVGVRNEYADRVRRGCLLGVWGADPGPDEGEPARIAGDENRPVLIGAKTFCSGAGGVEAALVMVRGREPGPPSLVLVEIDESVEIDRGWYRGSGLRASESHRVVFNSTPVRAIIGGPGELGRDPWFSRDAMRTTATWAGMADAAVDSSLAELAARRRDDPLAQLAAGRIAAAAATIDVWLDHAAVRAEDETLQLRSLAIQLRSEVAGAATRILDEAARACGSHPFATGSGLDRARRDLQLFTLQHRLDPLLQREGRRILDPEESP